MTHDILDDGPKDMLPPLGDIVDANEIYMLSHWEQLVVLQLEIVTSTGTVST